MVRKLLDIITVVVAIIILIAWIIDLRPVYKAAASVLGNPNNYIYNNVK